MSVMGGGVKLVVTLWEVLYWTRQQKGLVIQTPGSLFGFLHVMGLPRVMLQGLVVMAKHALSVGKGKQ